MNRCSPGTINIAIHVSSGLLQSSLTWHLKDDSKIVFAKIECRNIRRLIVIPAKAGNPGAKATEVALDPRFREGDDTLLIMLVSFRVGLLGH
jgi:hypothetical protein